MRMLMGFSNLGGVTSSVRSDGVIFFEFGDKSARSLNANAMQGRRETTHKAPFDKLRAGTRFFSRVPCTPSTLFPLPLTVLPQIQKDGRACQEFSLSPRGRLRGK